MNYSARLFFLCFFWGICTVFSAQVTVTDPVRPDPAREKMFFPYLAVRHGGPDATLKWKESNTMQYYRELWYYCNSFVIQKNYSDEGVALPESIIDISRFESQRKQNETAVVILPGFRDALILKAGKDLVYKPDYVQQQ